MTYEEAIKTYLNLMEGAIRTRSLNDALEPVIQFLGIKRREVVKKCFDGRQQDWELGTLEYREQMFQKWIATEGLFIRPPQLPVDALEPPSMSM